MTDRSGVGPIDLAVLAAAFDGITAQGPAAYPAPLATMPRAWTDQRRGEDINASLTRFEDAIRQDRADKNGIDP